MADLKDHALEAGFRIEGAPASPDEEHEILVWLDSCMAGRTMQRPDFIDEVFNELEEHVATIKLRWSGESFGPSAPSERALRDLLWRKGVFLRGKLSEGQVRPLIDWVCADWGALAEAPTTPFGELEIQSPRLSHLYLQVHTCPECNQILLSKGALGSHRGSMPCQARQARALVESDSVEVDRWEYGVNPHVRKEEVDWEPGSSGRCGRWSVSYWAERGHEGWCDAHGITALRQRAGSVDQRQLRRELKRASTVAQRFGESSSAQLHDQL